MMVVVLSMSLAAAPTSGSWTSIEPSGKVIVHGAPLESVVRTGAHWTFPGKTRSDLIEHLRKNHGYTRKQLESRSTESLLNLHDDAHTGVRANCPGGICPIRR